MSAQGELNFENGNERGHTQWINVRSLAAVEIARRAQLPVNRRVEVWLLGGIRLRGLLRLKEELLFVPEDGVRHLEFQVDGVTFTCREMESCVAID